VADADGLSVAGEDETGEDVGLFVCTDKTGEGVGLCEAGLSVTNTETGERVGEKVAACATVGAEVLAYNDVGAYVKSLLRISSNVK